MAAALGEETSDEVIQQCEGGRSWAAPRLADICGGGEGNRTLGPLHAKQVLSR